MTEHDDQVSLKQMLDHATEAIGMIEGRAQDELRTNRMLELALVRLVEIIGEAANRVSENTRAAAPQVPWRQLIGMRNKLIHGYDSIDQQILWDTVTTDLPPLRGAVAAILKPQPTQ